MLNPEHRKFLQEEMDKFLSNQDFAQAEGYVPEAPKADKAD